MQPDKFLDEITIELFRALIERGIPEKIAGESAAYAVSRIMLNWGGSQVYISKRQTEAIRHRNIKITDEYNGKNVNCLALKFGLTSRQIYNIIHNEWKRRRVSVPLTGKGNSRD